MSASDPGPLPAPFLPVGVRLKDANVNIEHINPALKQFLTSAGLVQLHLFDQELIVTSGWDGVHSPGSKHAKGDAVDLRISDVSAWHQPAFILALRVLCDRYALTLFDESNLAAAPHIHIEVAG